MATDLTNGSASLESAERRSRELAEVIERAHASDRRRIQSGEIEQADLFWVSQEAVQRAKVTWRRSFRLRK
mgnify:FL=1